MILKNASHLPCFLVDFWAGEKFIHPLQFMLSKNKVQGFPFKAYRKNLIIKREKKFRVMYHAQIWIVIASSFKHIKLIFNETAFYCSYTLQKKPKRNKKECFSLKESWPSIFSNFFLRVCLSALWYVSQNTSWISLVIVRMQILEKYLFVSRLLLSCIQLIVIFLYTWDTHLQVFGGFGFFYFLKLFGLVGFFLQFSYLHRLHVQCWAIIWIYLPLKETQCL